MKAIKSTSVSDDEVRVLLDRYKCPVVRTRFLGNIASPVMSASPIETVRGLWGGQLPPFDDINAANEASNKFRTLRARVRASWALSGWCPLERYRSPEARARDKPTVSPSGRSFATSTRATGARLKLCQAQAVGRFPAESYSLPILSFPLQPLRPHDARTRANSPVLHRTLCGQLGHLRKV
jgi:hypothetical protein